MKKIFVKPRPLTDRELANKTERQKDMRCACVRKPVDEGGALLSEKGEFVLPIGYWLRRVKSGDVVLVEQPVKIEKKRA